MLIKFCCSMAKPSYVPSMYIPTRLVNCSLLLDAIALVTIAYGSQLRYNSEPPTLHLLRVGKTLSDLGCSEAVIIAGIGHELLEQELVAYDQIVNALGLNVARLIFNVTENSSLPFEAFTDSLQEAPLDVLLVVGADWLDRLWFYRNGLAQAGGNFWLQIDESGEGQSWLYRHIINTLAQRGRNRRNCLSLAQQMNDLALQVFGP